MPSSVLAENVIKGAFQLWLHDANWYLKVDPDTFDVNSNYRCAVGQVFKDDTRWPYAYGLKALGITDVHAFEFGFDPWWKYEDEMTDEELKAVEYNRRVLNRMWCYLIRERQAWFNSTVKRLEAMRMHPSYKG